MSARGYRRHNLKRIVVGLDPDTFADVSAIAAAHQTSFSEAVRTLLTWGLESSNAEN